MKKRVLFSKGVASILAAAMAITVMPIPAYATNASDGQMTEAAPDLSDTQSIVYNTATLYNYSDTFYHNGTRHTTENQIEGKGDYNADTMDEAYELNPDSEQWEGLYFSAGGRGNALYETGTDVPANVAKNFTIGDSNSGAGEIKNGNAGLWNDDTTTKAWTTWTDGGNSGGYIELDAVEVQKVKTIKLYFLNNEGSGNGTNRYPSSVEVYNGAYSGDKTHLTTVAPDFVNSTETSATLEISLDSEVDTTALTFEFKYESGGYIILTEIGLYNETDRDTDTVSKAYADYNKWPGQSNGSKRSYIYSGLVKSTLSNGQIQFNVPQAGVFDTSSTSNKEVYTNVGLPFIYDSSTGYYTFDAGSDGYGVHFNDLDGDNVIETAEKKSGVNLVLDQPFTAYDSINENNKVGFFPFNCYGGTSSDAVYHFGMNTVINFTMTEDGTVNGNNGDPITFEFAGDDDVWVFIDGQLVLDLGGIHDSVSAKIDFKENQITMWSTDNKYGSGDKATDTEETEATAAGSVTELGRILNTDTEKGAIAKSYSTFSAEGEHKLAIYYLERGRGESNCKIKYNLPRQDALEVTKNIQLAENETEEITDEEWNALNALTFKMRVLDANGEPVIGKYALYNSSEYVNTYRTDENGYFTLKNNQKARFLGTLRAKYTVEEVATESELPSAIWKSAKWSGTLTAAKVTNLTESESVNDSGENTLKLTYSVADLETRSDEVDTLVINCTNYISRPFISVAGETVVIDYGLPVIVDIMANDVQSAGKAFIISNLSEPSYGTVKVVDKDGNEISADRYTKEAGYYYLEYTLNTYMSNMDRITYTYKVLSDELNGTDSYSYPTGVVTIIPATTMYYEENFLNSEGKNYIKFSNAEGYTGFKEEGSANKTYQEPGVVGNPNDSTYGTDVAYLNGNSDSNGTSYKADTTEGPAAFQYTFTGTGTAFFARTSENSGYLRVSVKNDSGDNMLSDADGERTNYNYIDTKYSNSAGENAYTVTLPLYNIPVFQLKDLPYDTYTVTVTVAKPSQWYMDQNEFYLDGIRVYDPIDMSQAAYEAQYYDEVYDAYEKDLEADVQINTLRNYMLDTQTEDPEAVEVTWTENSQVMFTDTNGEIVTASEYKSRGPKQELYMTEGQSIRFVLKNWFSDKPTDAKLYIGAKVPEGKTGLFKVNGSSYTINNTADCYYDITSSVSSIANSHDGLCVIEVDESSSLISFTNLKCPGFPNFSLAGMDEFVDGDEGEDGEVMVYSLLRRTVEESEGDPADGNSSESTEIPSEGDASEDTETPSEGDTSEDTETPSEGDASEDIETPSEGEEPDNSDSSDETTSVKNTVKKIVVVIKNVFHKLFR